MTPAREGLLGREGLLLQAARMSARVRRAYAALKVDPASKFYTYVLLLREGKVYVGSTDNPYQRLLDHHAMNRSAAVWVKEHGPPLRVLEMTRACRSDDERYKTLEYMDMFGWQNVRGSVWCRVQMRGPPPELERFRRGPRPDTDYLSREELDDVVASVRELADPAPDP